MSDYFLGVDTGSTKSEAIVATSQGRVAGYSRAGPGNWEGIGWNGTRSVLGKIIGEAASGAGIGIDEITGSGLGLAGYDWPEDYKPHLEILRELGLQGPLLLVNDAMLGLIAGAEAGWGVVISAGTSCNCTGRDTSGRIGRMMGSSYYAEYAGSTELVHHALQAVSLAWSLRGPQTALSDAFVYTAGAKNVDDLFAGLMRGRYQFGAEHALLVFETAGAGDAVAIEAVDWAGRQLGDLALGVIRQLELQNDAFEIILSGSFFKGSERLPQLIRDVVSVEAPGAQLKRLNVKPVVGGVLLGMEAAAALTPQKRRTLIESAAGNFGRQSAV